MATRKDEVIQITPISIKTVPIRIVGDSPLIVHAFGCPQSGNAQRKK